MPATSSTSLAWAAAGQRIDPAGIPGWIGPAMHRAMAAALLDAGQRGIAPGAAAPTGWPGPGTRATCSDQADFLCVMASWTCEAGHIPEAGAHLREALGLAVADR